MRPATALVVALIAGLPLAAGCGSGVRRENTPTTASAGTVAPGSAPVLEQQFEQVVKTVLPSVVQINTDTGLGSGIVYDTKGDIVTNDQAGVRRMIQTYNEVTDTTVAEGWKIEAKVSREWEGAGFDPAEIEARRMKVVERGRSQIGR